MKTSELISNLEKLKTQYGDLPVQFSQVDEDRLEVEIAGVSTCMSEDEKPVSFLICDENTLDAFVEV